MWVCRLWTDKCWRWECETVKFETEEEAVDCGEWFINFDWNDELKREYDVEEEDG